MAFKYTGFFLATAMLVTVTACGSTNDADTNENVTETINDEIMQRITERSELKDTLAGDIIRYFVENDAPNLGGYIEYDKETDPRQLLGNPGQYISKVDFSVISYENTDPENPFCVSIEEFEGEEPAKARAKVRYGSDEYSYTSDCVLMVMPVDVPLDDREAYKQLLDAYMEEKNATAEPLTEIETEAMPETPGLESEIEPEIEEQTAEAVKEPETAIKAEAKADSTFISNHENEVIAVATITLDRFISDYKMSLAPQLWTIAAFDDAGAVIATTDMTYNGITGKYLYIGTLNIKDGKVESATPHYVCAMNMVLTDDGYCDDFFDNISDMLN